MIDIFHQAREPLVNALSDDSRTGISAGDNPDGRVCDNGFKYNAEIRSCAAVSMTGFTRVSSVKTSFLWTFLYRQSHANRDDRADSRGNPDEPPPVKCRHTPHSQENKPRQ